MILSVRNYSAFSRIGISVRLRDDGYCGLIFGKTDRDRVIHSQTLYQNDGIRYTKTVRDTGQ